ncbi:hypothetical protein HK097_004227 [Rhizophlyctis rosea]|uniref:Uncharacterized protein n=1 Tax=Rhizophlyctis rosea TaxID=64517 RepID=A0AAD5S1J7_9FUNG|nr:hypothetical protein HK097_004227 [Rhizophlyctis rosea]
MHGIDETDVDTVGPATVANWESVKDVIGEPGQLKRTETRVSLTYRFAKNVVKVGNLFGRKK